MRQGSNHLTKQYMLLSECIQIYLLKPADRYIINTFWHRLVQAVGDISEVLGFSFPGCTINNRFAQMKRKYKVCTVGSRYESTVKDCYFFFMKKQANLYSVGIYCLIINSFKLKEVQFQPFEKSSSEVFMLSGYNLLYTHVRSLQCQCQEFA